MTERFEFEVDTTHANENWQREVEENLRRRQQEDEQYGGDTATGSRGSTTQEVDDEVEVADEVGTPTMPGGV